MARPLSSFFGGMAGPDDCVGIRIRGRAMDAHGNINEVSVLVNARGSEDIYDVLDMAYDFIKAGKWGSRGGNDSPTVSAGVQVSTVIYGGFSNPTINLC